MTLESQFCRRTRREFLGQAGAGFSGLALSAMLQRSGAFAGDVPAKSFINPMKAKPPMIPAKAKACIFIFCYGGPSHIDTFDYKPNMIGRDNQTVTVKTFGRAGHKNEGRIVEPRWKFKQYGQCGKYVSDLFPNMAKHVDDMAFVHSMYAESPIHGSAMLMMNSGKLLSGYPCMGSWVTYGLGSVNENLPGFVVMLDKTGGPISGPKNWTSGYMPAAYQGVILRGGEKPIFDLSPPQGITREQQRAFLDRLKEKNDEHFAARTDNSELSARIASYELAFKMQSHAPEAVEFSKETADTLNLYGIEGPTKVKTADFGRKCLLARRLVERGVRFIQIYSGGAHNDDNWDAHTDIAKNHNKHAGDTDLPIAGLITDLKRRGLLDSTIIVWGGEFGRQPTAEYATGTGRDHNSYAFTMWMAGGGIKGGVSVGETDELGSMPAGEKYHVKRLHATVLNRMGLDPNKLTYNYGGLDQKLVGVEGAEPIEKVMV
jgi:hypothetical protein